MYERIKMQNEPRLQKVLSVWNEVKPHSKISKMLKKVLYLLALDY